MAVKGNNPGNIRFNAKDKWQGLADPPNVGAFCSFTTPSWGIRAIARVLIAMQDKHECNTVREIISRYAPPADLNPTETYIANVCQWTGFAPLQTLNMHAYANARPLVEAIIRQEQGAQPYSDMQINEGLKLAGIVKPIAETATKSTAASPTVIGGSIVGAATLAQQVVGSVSGVWDSINSLGIDPRYVMGAAGLCAAIVAAWFIVEWIKRRQQGLA